MSVRTRGDLTTLPLHRAGAPPAAGAVRLDLNELPDGPLDTVRAALLEAAGSLNRYPDPGAGALVERIAAHANTTGDRVVVGCGSTSLCQQLIQATCSWGDQVVFGWPSFEAYPQLARIAGARSRAIPLTADHRLDLNAMTAAITDRTRLIFVCNPNNPTATTVRRDELTRFLDTVPASVLVVLDEAYREFVTDPDTPDGLQLLTGRDNIAVLRTFSKAHGLAALRVGYAIAAPAVITALRQVGIPFAVNTLAQTAAIASLDAADELRTRCAEITRERDWVRAELLHTGYHLDPSQANFLWLPLGHRTTDFTDHCRRHQVLVRGVGRTGVRVTISNPQDNDTFLSAARSFLDVQRLAPARLTTAAPNGSHITDQQQERTTR